MALIGKPTVKTTTAFDIFFISDNPYTINFTWTGQRCNGNRLTIIETGKTHDITGLSSTYHELTITVCNSLGLKNGNTYHATITMLDFEGNAVSNPSDQFLIYCYSTPTFSIRNITNNSTIKSTEFMALLDYYSNKMEISSYKFNLYDETGTMLLDSSNELYEIPDANTTDYSACSYTFKGLENNTSYRIEAKGVTIYGMELQCSYYFTVETNASSIYSTTSADATRDGNIRLDINCTPMGYESNDISYINNEEINLTNNNSYVKYTLMKPLDDFKFMGKLRGIKTLNKPILSFSDDTQNNISIIPTIKYAHNALISNLRDFNWKRGAMYTSGNFATTSSGNYYIDITYYNAPDRVTLNTNYQDYFYIYCYDENYNALDCDNGINGIRKFYFANIGQTYNTSHAKYVRFAFPYKSEYVDYQTKITLTMNYSETALSNFIKLQYFQYKDSTYIDYIESAQISFNLYVNDKQYTVNGSSFELLYDSNKDKFYLDENRNFKIEIIRKNGNYNLNVTEIMEGD